MAYVRQRITRTGTVSTALVESYRDGQATPATAPARQPARRARYAKGAGAAGRATDEPARGTETTDERGTDDDGEAVDVATARRVFAAIDAELAKLAREQTIIRKHCTATGKQIQAATRAYQQELEDAVNAAMGRMVELWGLEKGLKKAKTKVRRMREG